LVQILQIKICIKNEKKTKKNTGWKNHLVGGKKKEKTKCVCGKLK
jgi:hypothetical protein